MKTLREVSNSLALLKTPEKHEQLFNFWWYLYNESTNAIKDLVFMEAKENILKMNIHNMADITQQFLKNAI